MPWEVCMLIILKSIRKGQFINFDLSIYDKIVEVFIPDVKISENTKAKGRINGDEGKFILIFASLTLCL